MNPFDPSASFRGHCVGAQGTIVSICQLGLRSACFWYFFQCCGSWCHGKVCNTKQKAPRLNFCGCGIGIGGNASCTSINNILKGSDVASTCIYCIPGARRSRVQQRWHWNPSSRTGTCRTMCPRAFVRSPSKSTTVWIKRHDDVMMFDSWKISTLWASSALLHETFWAHLRMPNS